MPDPRSPRASTRSRDRAAPDPAYTLDDLCALAGVTVRTVRYYIGEGLLPPPTGHGTNARYTQEHLDRLQVIGAMKERYLPLRQIRRALDAMSDRELRETAEGIRQIAVDDGDIESSTTDAIDEPPAPDYAPARLAAMAMPPERSSAADYIADVLERDQPSRPRVGRGRARPPAPEPEAKTWRRVPITGEAELLIEEETYTRRREQIESLVAWAQRILNGT